MQPVQDLTVEDRISRTQYQYSLEDADPQELGTWVPRFVARLQTLPVLRDVASDQQNDGLQTRLAIDRNTASRLGITPQALDDDAVRRVRPATDLDDVHGAQSVPRRARSLAFAAEEP